MRRLYSAIVLTVVALCAAVLPVHAARFDFPGPIGYVNDYAGAITNDAELDDKLYDFDKAETTQILVIIVDKLPEQTTLDSFVPQLTDDYPQWRAGQDEFDNGVIFTVVMDDREMRIDVGYGLEGSLPDITTKQILDNEVRPKFREDDYNGGVEAGVNAIMEAVKGEYTPSQSGGPVDSMLKSDASGIFCMCFVFSLIFGLPIGSAFLGKTKSWWLGGVLGFIGGIIMSVLLIFTPSAGWLRWGGFACLTPLMTFVGLLFDYIVSKTYRIPKTRPFNTPSSGFWGGFSGGSSGGGGGGGFSAGGGSFGGGGSSSSW